MCSMCNPLYPKEGTNDPETLRKEVFRFSGLANHNNGKGLRTPFLHKIYARKEVPYDKYGK